MLLYRDPIDYQEQLHRMRVEYDRIQQSMKDHLKRPTPFERIKKFFGKNKSKRETYCRFYSGFFFVFNYIMLYFRYRSGRFPARQLYKKNRLGTEVQETIERPEFTEF